jgi:hypothetical protein
MTDEFMSVFLVFTVVIIGILIMIQLLSLEQLGSAIWRCLLCLAAAFIAVWLLKVLVLPILVCTLLWLKRALLGILVIVILVAALFALLRLVFLKIVNRHAEREREE